MKTLFISKVLILGLLFAAGGICTKAQGLSEGTVEADVPFAFIVGKKTFPAGKYTFKRADDTNPEVLGISDNSGRRTIFFRADNAEANEYPSQTKLVFDKIGDQYFLSEIWTSDTNFGYRLPKTNAEKSLEGADIKTEQRSIFGKLFRATKTSK